MGEPVDFRPRCFTEITEELTDRIERLYGPADGRERGEYRMVRVPHSREMWIMARLTKRVKNLHGEWAWRVLTVPLEVELEVDADDIGFDTFGDMEVIAWAAR
jgi:hypothetical protein